MLAHILIGVFFGVLDFFLGSLNIDFFAFFGLGLVKQLAEEIEIVLGFLGLLGKVGFHIKKLIERRIELWGHILFFLGELDLVLI